MARCRELAALSNESETRRSAVELLRVVADRRFLPWVSEFLDDKDAHVQSWGIGVLDQLLWSELIESEEAEEVLERAAHHENGARSRACRVHPKFPAGSQRRRVTWRPATFGTLDGVIGNYERATDRNGA